MNWSKTLFVGLLLAVPTFPSALVLYRADGKIQFADAANLSINGKDKVLLLGDKPEITGPINKLQSIKVDNSLIRDGQTGVFAFIAASGEPRFVYPEGLDRKSAPSPAEAWKAARIAFKKAQSDKTPIELASDQLLGYLPGGASELAKVCMNSDVMALLGGRNGAFAVQLELTAAAVAAYASQPSMSELDKQIAEFMRARLDRFENGIDSAKSLDEGLRFAELSAKAYPDNAEHQKYRKLLASRKSWLDRRVATVRALSAGGHWDAFLLAYGDLEKYQQSFPDLMQQHRQALQESRDVHWNSAKERMIRGEDGRAWSEMRIAAARHPSNSEIQKQLAMAWTEYSRQIAVGRRSQTKQISAGEQEALKQSLQFAARYKSQNKLDEALASVQEGEKVDPKSTSVMLAKADVLGARGEIVKALTALDKYDQYAVEDERSAGNKLRNDLLFQLVETLREARRQTAAAWSAGRYHRTLQLARKGLLANDKDPELLYYAGLASLAARSSNDGSDLLKRYLDVSNTLDEPAERRAAVTRLVGGVPKPQSPAIPGAKNWFSGAILPVGTYYCPISLAFQPRIDKVVASNKLSLRYTWNGDQLQSIVPVFEKMDKSTGEKPAVFTYDRRVPHAAAVDLGEAPRILPADPDDLIRASNVLLANNPLVDPRMVERLTGKPVTVGVSGNRFFHPFVWERPYYFSFEYDDRGRVRFARQLTSTDSAGGAPVIAEFEWDNLRLTALRVYATNEGKKVTLMYERTQQYAGEKLVGELVQAGGKTSRIKYVYTGSQLTSAQCEKDEAIDHRSRDVFFLATAPSGKGR